MPHKVCRCGAEYFHDGEHCPGSPSQSITVAPLATVSVNALDILNSARVEAGLPSLVRVTGASEALEIAVEDSQ